MLIKTLRLENFRQFKGTTQLEFSCNPEQNVTIILGDNTFGKTTLLQSFNWCFYGKALFNDEPDFLLNKEVAHDMFDGDIKIVEVEIIVKHDDTEYIISRTQRYTCSNGSVRGEVLPKLKISFKQADGQTEPIKEERERYIINKILPEDLSSYFFFDTERVNSISTKKDVAEAVKGILGLSIMDNALKHLGDQSKSSTVIGQFYNELDLEGNAKAEEAQNRMKMAEEKRRLIADQINNCNSQIKQYEIRKEQLNSILKDNQTTSTLQKRKEDLERRINNEKRAMEESINKYFKEFSHGAMSFFAQPLIKKANKLLKEVKIDDKGVKDLTRNTIMELIHRGKCICGCDIREGSEAYEHLKAELAYVPPESIGYTVRHYREKLDTFSNSADRIYEYLTDHCKNVMNSKERINDWSDTLYEISNRIKGKENMKKYEVELSDVNNRIYEQNRKKENLLSDDGFQKNEMERYKKIYDKLISTSSKNKQIMIFIAYAEKIRDWLAKTYKEKEILIRDELEIEVNKIFEKMYHGNRRVAIDSKYQVTLLTSIADEEVVTGESEGLNRVKNFAFIAGLVSLAKRKITTDNTKEGFDLSSEPYPLVMDAPFSNADEKHTANISKVLPEVAEQVIMFVMQKDWNYAEPVMLNRIGKKYHLDKISETFTKLS